VTTLDAQPASSTAASILVLVTGQLVVDDGQNILSYCQMFHVRPDSNNIFEVSDSPQLVPEGQGYFVQNDVFRL
jgi:hypothetical protein